VKRSRLGRTTFIVAPSSADINKVASVGA